LQRGRKSRFWLAFCCIGLAAYDSREGFRFRGEAEAASAIVAAAIPKHPLKKLFCVAFRCGRVARRALMPRFNRWI